MAAILNFKMAAIEKRKVNTNTSNDHKSSWKVSKYTNSMMRNAIKWFISIFFIVAAILNSKMAANEKN